MRSEIIVKDDFVDVDVDDTFDDFDEYEPWIGVNYRTANEDPALNNEYTGKQLIVLFTSEQSGVVLLDESDMYEIGHYSDGWEEDYFDYYDGEIKVSNDEIVD